MVQKLVLSILPWIATLSIDIDLSRLFMICTFYRPPMVLLMWPTSFAGFLYNKQSVLLWSTVIYSVAVILSQLALLILWTIAGENWNVTDIWWIKLLGFMMWELVYYDVIIIFEHPDVIFFQIVPSYICWFYYSCRVDSWRSPSVVYFLVLQLLAGLVASVELNWNGFQWQDSFWNGFLCTVEHIGEIILAWSLWSYTLRFLL